jgi:hypothetical protein
MPPPHTPTTDKIKQNGGEVLFGYGLARQLLKDQQYAGQQLPSWLQSKLGASTIGELRHAALTSLKPIDAALAASTYSDMSS